MATLDISLAWSMPIPVETLGPHLQAYVELQPVITTLRLCNRYGKGSQAAITTLPVELVTQIEDHLMADERKKQRKNWKTDFACFQGLCKPTDHLSDSEQVEIWLDISCSCGCCDSGSECDVNYPPKKLNKNQRESVTELLQDMLAENGPEEAMWWMEHENRVSRWEGKTGAPTGQDRGLLSNYAALLLSNFGLATWVTHTQPKKQKKGQFTETGVYASTLAYLTLPSVKTRENFDRGFSEALSNYGEMPYLATESGGGVPVVMPGELSKVDIFKFSRAVKMLGLKPKTLDGTKAMLSAANKDDEAATTYEGDTTAADGSLKKWAPKLRMLYSVGVDEGY